MVKCLGLWQQGVQMESQLQTGTDPPRGTGSMSQSTRALFPTTIPNLYCYMQMPERLRWESTFRLTSAPHFPKINQFSPPHKPETASHALSAKSDFLSIIGNLIFSLCIPEK
jgi:hypothetical protein